MNLYIFNAVSKAAVFGIGTYVRELTEALRYSNINVHVVNIMAEDQTIRMAEIDGVQHWYFPSAIRELRTIDRQKQDELYYRNVVYLLQLYIEDKANLIFHLNYNQSIKLAEELKSAFDCRIVATVHYFEWSLSCFGNIKYFRQF